MDDYLKFCRPVGMAFNPFSRNDSIIFQISTRWTFVLVCTNRNLHAVLYVAKRIESKSWTPKKLVSNEFTRTHFVNNRLQVFDPAVLRSICNGIGLRWWPHS